MNIANINTVLICFFSVIFIFIDYLGKYKTDRFQRGVFFAVLLATLLAVITDFAHHVFLKGRPGGTVTVLMYITLSLFYIAQNCAYYAGVIFVDYFAHGSIRRSTRILRWIVIFLFIHILSVICNLFFHYYFFISQDNYYTLGPLYALRLGITYFSVVLYLAVILTSVSHFNRSQIYSLIFFVFLSSLGAGIDIVSGKTTLLWPCFSAGILYLYFFIALADTKIDSLTGLGNRSSFNEFMATLVRRNSRESYSIVLIDMDDFKQINDTFGHLAGDRALQDMAGIIKGSTRRTDFAARFGGDEFIIAAKVEYDISVIINRIQNTMELQNNSGSRPYILKMSYGLGVYTANAGQPVNEFLKNIDELMYKHKDSKHSSESVS